MKKYELSRLLEYDENGILEEIRRVAKLIPSPIITARTFDKLSKVESSTVRRRFGGWRTALEKAGLGQRYSGAIVTDRMRSTEKHTNEDIVNELKRVADELGSKTFTAKTFDSVARIHSATAVRHFGSWAEALKKASLEPGKGATRYTDGDYFENLCKVWTYHGRQPKYGEMDLPPSVISSGAYERKWGKWTNALRAFVEKMESDTHESEPSRESNAADLEDEESSVTPIEKFDQYPKPVAACVRSRTPSPRLQFLVMRRDNFKCQYCGRRSPATHHGVTLHLDHRVPFSQGGATDFDNLLTACSVCNLGKGDLSASEVTS
jgi:HNH endonuclease/Homing endonuclease associated repeat